MVSDAQTKCSPSSERGVSWRHTRVFGVPQWSLMSPHFVVCGVVCVAISFFHQLILNPKWKGISFGPNLAFIQGRHSRWKTEMRLPILASRARKEKPRMKWQMQRRSKKAVKLDIQERTGSLWRTVWMFLKKLKIELPYDPAIPLLGIYPEKTIIQKESCTNMFIAALFTIARTWKQPKCPSTDEWIKKMWHIYTMEYYSAIKRNEMEVFVMRWMDLETVIQSEVSQKEENKYTVC